jgi:hypothetical protein
VDGDPGQGTSVMLSTYTQHVDIGRLSCLYAIVITYRLRSKSQRSSLSGDELICQLLLFWSSSFSGLH